MSAVWLLALLQAPLPKETLRLYAVGDINFGRTLGRAFLAVGGETGGEGRGDTLNPFRELRDTLRGADLLFGNLESMIAPPGHQVESAGMAFTAPPVVARELARAGFDIVSTANNHAWDAGRAGLLETMDRLTRAGVRFVGTGVGRAMAEQPIIVRRRGWRVAFFAVTRAFNAEPDSFYTHRAADFVAWGDTSWLYPAVRRLKASGRADLVVVSVHGGEEYAAAPRRAYLHFLTGLVDAGADLVLAHHPHVLQPLVWHRGKPIAPSLGNFVFDQDQPWTQLSAVLRVEVAPDGSIRVTALPVRAGFRPELARGPAADSVRGRLGLPLSFTAVTP